MSGNVADISYDVERDLDVIDVRRLWEASGFLEYNPNFDWNTLPSLLANSNLIIVARENGRMVGMTRAVTDFALYCGLVDMMVDRDYQKRGIGSELVNRTRAAAGENAWLTALAPDAASGFYERIGCQKVEDGWTAWVMMPPGFQTG